MFCELLDAPRKDIVDNRIRDLLPGIENASFNWTAFVLSVMDKGGTHDFEEYLDTLNIWIRGRISALEENVCDLWFEDATSDYLVSHLSKQCMKYNADTVEYPAIAELVQRVSGAQYVMLNIFYQDTQHFKTLALAADHDAVSKASTLLGEALLGREWHYVGEVAERLRSHDYIHFSDPSELLSMMLSSELASKVVSLFGIDEIVVLHSRDEYDLTGDLILYFTKGQQLKHRRHVETSADIIGMLFSRLQAETQLRERSEMLSLITENMLDMVALTDPVGNFTYVGKSHEQLGYGADELLGRNVLEYVHPDEVQGIALKMADLSRPHETRRVSYRFRRVDGEYTWLETVGRLLLDEDGNARSIIFSSRDISERVRYEEELKESEKKYRIFIEKAVEAIVLTDEEGRVIEWNPVQETISGISREEALGMHIWQLQFQMLPEGHRNTDLQKTLQKRFTQLLREGTLPGIQERVEVIVHNGVSERRIRQSVFTMKTNRGYRLGSIAQDITDSRSAEENMKRTMSELARLNDVMTGRELRILELKEEINGLRSSLGKPPAYDPGIDNKTALLHPLEKEEKFSLDEFLDIEALRDLFEHFSRLTGFTTGLVDAKTGDVRIATGWHRICTDFHRQNEASRRHCRASNTRLTEKFEKP